MYRILSLDGGGIRGVLTATLLGRLEAHRPGFLASIDLFAGTSTGGVLALGLALGLTPAMCSALYEKYAADVFDDTLADDVRDLGNAVGAKYTNAHLKRRLENQFGNGLLADLPKRVLVSAFDLDNEPQNPQARRTWKPKFFHNFPGAGTDGGERVVDVALRATAAPTYFPVYQGYIDGGVVAMNPSMCALAQALDSATGGQRLAEVVLLSVGTGRIPRFLTTTNADWGWAQWANPLLHIAFDEGNRSVADYQCQRLLGECYHRLDPILPEAIDLDDYEQVDRVKDLAVGVDLTITNHDIVDGFLSPS